MTTTAVPALSREELIRRTAAAAPPLPEEDRAALRSLIQRGRAAAAQRGAPSERPLQTGTQPAPPP